MFKSALGLRRSTGEGQCHLVRKAVDFDRSVEVLPIGGIGGEDVPFEGTIFAIKFPGKVIPFISKKQQILGVTELTNFNKSKWEKTRAGEIPIIVFQISNIGMNLKSIPRGVRSTVGYSTDLWQDDFHGYTFSNDEEYRDVVECIRQAIPVLCFDNYSLPQPAPAICVGVELEGEDSGITNEAVSLKDLKALVDHLTSETMESKELYDFIARIGDWVPLTLEQLSCRILDVERAIFSLGLGCYPRPLWTSGQLIDALRRSYSAYYVGDFPSFEVFLIRVISLLQERYFARAVLEKYFRQTALGTK